MSKMDFSGFKKVAQDGNTATFRHEKLGHELKIAHKKLSPSLKKQLDALPIQNFSAGGDVLAKEEVESEKDSGNIYTPSPPSPELQGNAGVDGQDPRPAPAPQDPGPANTAPQAASDPAGLESSTQAKIKALGEQKSGQQMVAQEQGNLGQRQAGVESQRQVDLQKNQTEYAKANQALTAERLGLQSDIAKSHINPNQYIDNMSTGKAIRTGIGLILGGMGAGLTHGPNMAFQFLQNQIDRDIQGQRDELGKKQNLLTHNLQSAGNLRAATEMTRLHTNDIISSQLRAEADKAQNPIAKGNLLDIAGRFDMQSAELQHQLSIMKMQQSVFSGGQPSAMAVEMLPAEMRERAVQLPGGGFARAYTKEGAKEVREQVQTMQPIFNALDRLKSLGPAAMVPGSPASKSAESLRAQLIPLINENANLKRLSSEDIQNINHMFTDPSRFSSLFGSAQTDSFKNFLQDKLVSTMGQQLEGMGGKPAGSSSSGHNFGFVPKKYLSPKGK